MEFKITLSRAGWQHGKSFGSNARKPVRCEEKWARPETGGAWPSVRAVCTHIRISPLNLQMFVVLFNDTKVLWRSVSSPLHGSTRFISIPSLYGKGSLYLRAGSDKGSWSRSPGPGAQRLAPSILIGLPQPWHALLGFPDSSHGRTREAEDTGLDLQLRLQPLTGNPFRPPSKRSFSMPPSAGGGARG